MIFKAFAATQQGKPLEVISFDPGQLGPEDVEIAVENCGICHSDLSVLNSEWGETQYPFVPGHEVAGTVASVGSHVTMYKKGDRVGLGWWSKSCMTCDECMGGDHNLCRSAEATILGRHGGFANRVRAHQAWVVGIPDATDMASVGPMFCGGITVFNPILQNNIQPTMRVGVVGIGGLGHIALQFLRAWGCHVTAFTSSPSKVKEAKELGAHDTINSRSDDELKAAANSFDMIMVTVNVPLNWDLYIAALRPKGVLHIVGAIPEIKATPFPMILGQKSINASPVGSPVIMRKMIEFSARHDIKPVIETFPMSKVNEAFKHLESGKARYRIVLENDLG